MPGPSTRTPTTSSSPSATRWRRSILPIGWFDDLLSAFRQDVTVTRYGTWADLLDYCRRSANPVGPHRAAAVGIPRLRHSTGWSDAVCSALQITNFLQDLGRDWRAGRLYVPADVQATCGADARRPPPGAADAGVAPGRRLLRRTNAGALPRRASRSATASAGRLRLELRLTWLGGMRVLERVTRSWI